MSTCKWCNQGGWYLSVNSNGLCTSCQPTIAMDVTQRVSLIQNSLKLVGQSKNIDTQLSSCDLIVEQAKYLLRFSSRGIPTMQPPPTALIEQYERMRGPLIVTGLARLIDETERKTGTATTVRTKISQWSKTLLKIREFQSREQDSPDLRRLEQQAANKIQEIQLYSYIEDAQKAEFKGKTKVAADKYYEALYLLHHDDIDDALQGEHIAMIEKKIAELTGKPPEKEGPTVFPGEDPAYVDLVHRSFPAR